MKKYQNGICDGLIESRVQRMKFQNEFKPYVIDIIKRRAYQYDFTYEQVELDLDRLTNSLKLFTVDKTKNLAGAFYLNEKRININPKSYDSKIELYSTFTHELYHALANEDGYDTMESINRFSFENNYSLLEVLVEKSAFRTVYPVKTSNPYYNNNTSGYEKMCFASEMLCATFGITEQELFSNSIQGRDLLINFLSNKSNIDKDDIDIFLDRFEMNLAVLHNRFYGDDKETKNAIKWDNIGEALGNMKTACVDMQLLIFEKIPSEELSEEKFNELKFNFNKLGKVVNYATKFSHKRRKILKKIDEISGEDIESYANGLVQTKYLLEFEKTHTLPIEFENFKNWARYGNLGNFDSAHYKNGLDGVTLSSLGISLPPRISGNTFFKVPRETIRKNKEPKEKTDEWDNSIVEKGGLNKVIRQMRRKDILMKIKNALTGRKFEALEPATSESKSVSDISSQKQTTLNNLFTQGNQSNIENGKDNLRRKRIENKKDKSDDFDEI